MDAFVFRAALWCDDCTDHVKKHLPKPAHVDEGNENSFDSGDWPKGPYADGGGEADYACHCDGCGVFLENRLTDDGVTHVAETVFELRPYRQEVYDFYADDHPPIRQTMNRKLACEALGCDHAEVEALIGGPTMDMLGALEDLTVAVEAVQARLNEGDPAPDDRAVWQALGGAQQALRDAGRR